MFCDSQSGLTFADARGAAKQLSGAAANYHAATFIDYFRARNRSVVADEHLALYTSRPRCVASSHALYSGHLTQSAATWYVRHDLQEILQGRFDRTRHWSFSERCVELVTHVSRLFYLSANDPQRPTYDKDWVRNICDAYRSDRDRTDPTIWRVRVARFTTGPAALLHDASPVYRETRDFDEYLAYWRAANVRLIDELLSNRRFCAGIDALALRLAHNGAILPILSALDEAFSEQLHPLFRRLRHRFYAKLAAEVDFGLLELPQRLRDQFPDVYDVSYA